MSTRQSISRLTRLVSAVGRFLADMALFAGTILVLWGGMTWLGVAVDRALGTAPGRNAIIGQAGPFAMLGLVTGCIASLYALNWIVTRVRRDR